MDLVEKYWEALSLISYSPIKVSDHLKSIEMLSMVTNCEFRDGEELSVLLRSYVSIFNICMNLVESHVVKPNVDLDVSEINSIINSTKLNFVVFCNENKLPDILSKDSQVEDDYLDIMRVLSKIQSSFWYVDSLQHGE